MGIDKIIEYLQTSHTKFDSSILDVLKSLKQEAINNNNEEQANYIWCLQQIFTIQSMYISTYYELKNEHFEDAWRQLERVEIEISFLYGNFDCSDNKYNIELILKNVHNIQKLYPYEFFMSREGIIKSEKCSICGKVVKLHGGCNHRPGKLYNGEICFREVTDYQFLAEAIVKNPFDKYTVIHPQGMEYNYSMVKMLTQELNSPYERWDIIDTVVKRPEYSKVRRCDPCPCGSNKRYKNCCRGTGKELMTHHTIVFENASAHSAIPPTQFSTWK